MAKKETQSREPTKRQIAMSRREKEQQKLVFTGLGLVAALVAVVLAIGLAQTYIIEPNSPVGSVNGQAITTGEYQDRVRYERFVLEDQYQQIVQELQALPPADENDQFSEFLRGQYQQLANQVLQQRSTVDRQTFDNMVTERLIEAEAEKRGLTVSEDEITESINRLLAGRRGGLTALAAQETSTAVANAEATAALWTPTPTFTPSPTLTSTQATTQPVATPANTPTPAPTPTPNIINQTDLSADYTNWINQVTDITGISEAQYRSYIRQNLIREKLRDALGEETPKTAQQANARHILVETEDEAKEVVARLEAGEDFAALAEELSLDTGSAANGGELGFAPQGRFVEAFDEAVFSLPIGQISDPIETQFGWHIIEVLAREEMELTPADYAQEQRAAFATWTSQARQNAQIEDLWTPEKAPEDPVLQQ
ncbi:MAG: hypothetical protein Kow0031_23910 [Anaerolineae bacterium]